MSWTLFLIRVAYEAYSQSRTYDPKKTSRAWRAMGVATFAIVGITASSIALAHSHQENVYTCYVTEKEVICKEQTERRESLGERIRRNLEEVGERSWGN